MARVLLIDDDPALVELLTNSLGAEGFEARAELSGEAGLARARSERFDLILLDVMMPGASGFETLRRLRATHDTPVIMLTARGEETDRITGLESGADDYLPKPFNTRELTARMHAILRRAARGTPASHAPGITLDAPCRTVRRDGVPVDLTSAEFDLLRSLMSAGGEPVAREQLCRQVFGREYSVFDRGIDNLISGVRRKLGPTPDGRERIKTVRNVGYVWADH